MTGTVHLKPIAAAFRDDQRLMALDELQTLLAQVSGAPTAFLADVRAERIRGYLRCLQTVWLLDAREVEYQQNALGQALSRARERLTTR